MQSRSNADHFEIQFESNEYLKVIHRKANDFLGQWNLDGRRLHP